MKKRERGAFEVFSDDKVTFYQWNDNRPVCVVSNHKGVDPIFTVRGWSSATKNAVSIVQPRMIKSYNKHMGSVDLLDRFLSDYRPRLCRKKWWWCPFANFLNVSVVAAWQLHNELKGKMSHLQFRREIVRTLFGKAPDKTIRPGPSRMLVDGTRFGGVFRACEPAAKQGRCKQCKKIPYTSANNVMYCFT